jgi:hypothetical protein
MDGTIQTIPPQHLSDNLVDTEHGIHPWLSKQMVKISAFQTPTKNTKIQKTKEAINQTLFPGQWVEKDQNQDIDQDIDSEITNTILLIYLAITDQVAMDPLEYLQDYDDRKPYIKEIKAIIEEEETNFYPENQYLDLLMGINEDLKRDYRLTSDQPLDSAWYIQQITEELKKDNVINTCIRDRDINIDNVTMIMKYYNIILQEKSQYKQTTERRKKALEKRLKGILKIGEDCELELAYIGDTIKDHSKKKIEWYYSAYYKTYMRYNDPQDGDDFYNDDNEHIRG